ncbi:hypothetical protein QQX98_002589 [Neonectria punicea]|uniref:Xylanolytic transcriptional activator regulatory domain-containing protein n=1 Tax=Neonectria punicea TaxID=979145 RepID=A0ABR1HIQ8_9HYPO
MPSHARDRVAGNEGGGDETDGDKRGQEIVVANTDPSERPAKKPRRGSYISRACKLNNARKPRQPALFEALLIGEVSASDILSRPAHASQSLSPVNHEVLGRLAEVERHLQLLRASTPYSYSLLQRTQRCPPTRISVDGQPKSASAELISALETDGQTFAGELSMTPPLDDEDESMDCSNTASYGMLPEYPSPGSSLHHPTTRRVRGWLESILAQHGVVADEQQWRYDLQHFMEEVHPFYACLHPPKVWETFNDMWEYSALWSVTDAAGRERQRLSLALVFFCLALGRCGMPLTMPDASAAYSSGWGLYSVGMTLLQGGMETSSMATKSLLMPQALVIRVVYLFRLDANQQAARVLALIVSMAHTIGMHRQSTMDTMPAFHNQLYCRTWWVIYMLDRRIAIESGKPYLIQDCNVDTAMPIDLGEEWMTRFATRSETVADLQHDIAAELARDRPPSHVPYTVSMIRYSRVAGKAWDVLYGVKSSNTPMSAIVEHLDTVLSKLLDTAPRDLKYPPEAPSETFSGMSLRWKVKQSLVLFTCCTYLRLLIRRPFVGGSRGSNLTDDDEFEPATVSASLAARILKTHQSIKDDGLKYSFALSHYVTSCTMVMLGQVSREPSLERRYGDLIQAATRSLRLYCHRNWVSGKMTRLVSRLSQLVQRTLANNASDNRSRHSPAGLRQDWGLETQLTPQAEDRDSCQIQHNTRTSILETSDGNDLSIDVNSGARRDQWSDSFAYGNATEALSANAQRNELLGNSWMTGPSTGVQNDWVISDLSFEAIVGGGDESNAPELSRISENERPGTELAGNSISNQSFDESKLSALGLNGVVDLDMDVDLSIMNLWDTSPMLNLDTLG